MKRHSNGVRGLASPDRKVASISNNNNSKRSGSPEIAHDGKRSGSPGGGDTIAAMWPPKFVIALTNKEKEEDFMAIKGSKLATKTQEASQVYSANAQCKFSFFDPLSFLFESYV
ncbi:hypothetical protein PHJA_002272200 [Phtheirospermum japonicum]|uniref:Uncharacterized protein n=1 Tax=Phtheirospermum japonicum TaxID=374723 RepID=A0A830CSV2_9LAMI|nr:hypothetical protein PHJA_002272200 [Phtheirospermum japonicum]